MLVFHGGLTIEQVKKFENEEHVIFQQIQPHSIYIPRKNTFDYFPVDETFLNDDDIRKYISEDIYKNQYIFLFKYLKNALNFCVNSKKQNYILVADINENILENYIGIGRYIGNQIEYRLPRQYISKKNIIDFLFFEPFDSEQMAHLNDRFGASYYDPFEDKDATEILKVRKLTFNEYKNFNNH